jgi:hypothetical protein
MVRGIVTSVSADHLTLKTDAGDVYQVVGSANTRVTKDRQPAKFADIQNGDGVGAMGVLDAPTKTVHAVFVGVMDAEQVKKARENMGKTYITGKVTAIDMDALKITVMRSDGVSQVIGVDEQTSFRRGGRSMAAVSSGGASEMGTLGGARSSTTESGAPNAPGGESITFADIKVGDIIAGRGTLKNNLFVPAELGVIDPSRRRRRGVNGAAPSEGTTSAPAGTAGPTNPAGPQRR